MLNKPEWLTRWKERLLQSRINRIARKLDLDSEQRNELETIMLALREAKQALWRSQAEMRRELSVILQDEDIDALAIRTEINESMEELKQHVDAVADRLAVLVSHLDSAQRQQLAQMLNSPRRSCPAQAAAL